MVVAAGVPHSQEAVPAPNADDLVDEEREGRGGEEGGGEGAGG